MSPYIAPGIYEPEKPPLEAICEAFQTTEEIALTKTRTANVVIARNLCMIYFKVTQDCGIIKAALRFNLDHATYLHAVKTMRNRYQTEKNLRATIDKLSIMINFDFKRALK